MPAENAERACAWTMRPLSLWERLLIFFCPEYRQAYEKRLREDLRYLVAHPEVEVHFDAR